MTGIFADTIRQFWKTTIARDWDNLGKLLAEDMIYNVPQTRERVRGKAAFIEFFDTYPGNWTLKVESIIADDQHAVSKISFEVNGNSETGISFFEFRNGLISGITDYWPVPYDPPARMTTCIERY